MTSPTPAPLRRWAYAVFYRLPSSIRRQLVRAAMGKYVLGAVAMVFDAEAAPARQILLLRQPPGVGWSLPAGLLARGEAPVAGCARELSEETGLTLAEDDFAPARPNAVVHHQGRWVDVVFTASVVASEAQLTVDGAEVYEARFHRVDNLPPLTGATARLLSHYGIGPLADYPEVRA